MSRLRPHRRKIGIGALVLILIAGAAVHLMEPQRQRGQTNGGGTISEPAGDLSGVASVIDGDTIEIHGTRIRLYGIDAPESRQLCRDAENKEWRCGKEAAFALSGHIGSAPVECDKRDMDKYGRTVAVCRQNGADLNLWMVENGWAVAYRHYSEDYGPAEDRARAAKTGIWAGSFENPYEWRKSHNSRR
jgi:endonuclease YncB( thermonuclease family)